MDRRGVSILCGCTMLWVSARFTVPQPVPVPVLVLTSLDREFLPVIAPWRLVHCRCSRRSGKQCSMTYGGRPLGLRSGATTVRFGDPLTVLCTLLSVLCLKRFT